MVLGKILRLIPEEAFIIAGKGMFLLDTRFYKCYFYSHYSREVSVHSRVPSESSKKMKSPRHVRKDPDFSNF